MIFPGDNRLVVRIWKGGSRWWNLNHHNHSSCRRVTGDKTIAGTIIRDSNDDDDDGVIHLARSEVAGYRVARQALMHHGHGNNITIPRILYFSLEHHEENASRKRPMKEKAGCDDKEHPRVWAVFEYVGTQSTALFGGCDDRRNGGIDKQQLSKRFPNQLWMNSMVKVREEFGYLEPHPRWGRVPVDTCVKYTLTILRTIILPLHRYLMENRKQHQCSLDMGNAVNRQLQQNNKSPPPAGCTENDSKNRKSQEFVEAFAGLSGYSKIYAQNECSPKGYEYNNMVTLYRAALSNMQQQVNSCSDDPDNLRNTKSRDPQLVRAIDLLSKAVSKLEQETAKLFSPSSGRTIEPLPPVLCHMDLQPQNIIFGSRIVIAATTRGDGDEDDIQSIGSRNRGNSNERPENSPLVSSILDWEEAAYADPRFELLLLCRKVCANRSQADLIWKTYGEELPASSLGPIEPWLKLETVHSLTTLLLQSMDLLGGGRNPWETKPDLWGKIGREFQRLVQMGWSFCEF